MRRTTSITSLILAATVLASIITITPSPGLPAVVSAQTRTEPELPRLVMSTSYVAPTGSTIMVGAGSSLQNALNQARPGDEIVLEAGATFVGGFTLPAKAGEGWITIRSSNTGALPAAGARVGPGHSAYMPRLLSEHNNLPVFRTQQGAHHYRLMGLEISVMPAVTQMGDLVRFGDGSAAQSTLEGVPHHLIIDRCYIHGRSNFPLKRGVALNSAWSAVIDSYISEVHVVGQDTQAIAGWNGPGPFKIANNYLEAAGENIMFGGSDPLISGLLPSDIEILGNHLFKPLSWKSSDPSYQGTRWTVKNLLELKLGRRVLIDGNIFENCWTDGQIGYAILIKTSNQSGKAPWSTTEDVTIANNKIVATEVGIQIAYTSGVHPNEGVRRIKVSNNLFERIKGPFARIIDGPEYVTFDHNTALQTGSVIMFSGAPAKGFVFTNNISPHNTYGVKGDGKASGLDSLNHYSPAHTFVRNALPGGVANKYPADNFFVPTLDEIGFVDLSRGNYRLRQDSRYLHAGTDGKDVGADIDIIEAALSGGETAAPNQPPYVTLNASVTWGYAPLSIEFFADAFDPDGTVTTYSWDFGDGQTSVLRAVSHVYNGPGTYIARVQVRDDAGADAHASVTISVSSLPSPNQPPQVTISASPSTSGPSPLNVSFASNATDADGRIVAYRWEFGDGMSSSEPAPSHVYIGAGQYTAALTVTDNAGATATDRLTINVTQAYTQPTVRVLTPNKRKTLKGASIYEITWSSEAVGLTGHELHLSLDNGKTWNLVVAGLPSQAKRYEWQVVNTAAKKARIRVLSRAGHLIGSDMSDRPFTITKTKTRKKEPRAPKK